jgi:Spy/CpxP family protein refolding chaperone
MKRFLLLLALGTTLTTLHAQTADSTDMQQEQPKASPSERTAHQLTALTKKLNLTQDQVMQLRPILLNEISTLDSLRTHPAGNRRSGMQARRNIMQDTDSRITALLTDQQKPLYQEWKDEQKKKLMDRRRNRQSNASQ